MNAPLQGLTKEDVVDLVDKRLAALVQQGKRYIYVFSIGFILLAGIGIGLKQIILAPIIKWIYPPTDIRDDLVRLSALKGDEEAKALENNVIGFLHDHVDSGYTKVIVFPIGHSTSDNYIPFYATKDQVVELTITIEGQDLAFRYTATVDQKPIDDNVSSHVLSVSDHVDNFPVEEKLNFGLKGGLGANFHIFKVSPASLPTAEVIVDCFILVKNVRVK